MSKIDALIATFNEKKEFVDNHSEDCSLEIKSYCKAILDMYKREKSKLIQMINSNGNNQKIFRGNYEKFGLYMAGTNGIITALGITEDYLNSIHLNIVPCPRSGLERSSYNESVINWNSNDVDYWVKMKKYCDFRVKELEFIVKRIEQTIEYAIELQNKRKTEICETLCDIDKNTQTIPRIEIRIVTK